MLISPKSKKGGSNQSKVTSFLKPTILIKHMAYLRYTCLVALALGVSSQTTPTQANNLDSFLGSMYSNTTDAGYFQTQQRGVIAGGSFTGRFPIKPINIVQFDQPRVSGSCGGVNLFGGSFSFINAQELTQLMRTIAQNALGLLFQLGLNSISQPLSSLLTTWSRKLQDMNATLKNSCEAARKLFQIDYSGQTVASTWEAVKGIVSVNSGEKKDYFSEVKAQFQKGWRSLTGSDRKQTTAEKAATQISSSGNVTWRALNASTSYKAITTSTAQSDDEAKYLLMSIIGTEIFPVTQNPEQNESCPTGAGNCEVPLEKYKSTITVDDLMSPDPNKLNIIKCDADDNGLNDDSCTKVDRYSLASIFKGTAYIVNKAFYGIDSNSLELSADQISQALGSRKGIIGKSAFAGAQLTEEELKFHNALPMPVVRYMNAIRNDPLQMANLAERIRIYLIRDMAARLALKLVDVSSDTFNGKTIKAKPPETMSQSLNELRTDAYNNRLNDSEYMQFDSKLREYVTFMSNSQYNSTIPSRN